MMANTWPGWKNVGLLGEGSFGKVFRIQREEFGQVYEAALKRITIPSNEAEIRAAYEEGMDEKSVTDYFRSCVEDIVAEFALMSQLKGNSNIVSYEDHMVVQHEDGIGWDILIRMELLTPLQTYVSAHPLEEEDVIRLGIDLSRALKLCRKKGILHRDIKPENIFVSNDGDFKLGDFGVARVAEKTVAAMSKKGTYNYMAPEVYKGEQYGFTADLYSLGLVLYRFLNDNRLPYMPPAPKPVVFIDKERALSRRMMGDPMPAPAHGSDQLKAVILKACAYLPEDRFVSAEELEQALNALEQPVYSMPEEPAREEHVWEEPVGEAPVKEDPWEEDEDEDDSFGHTISAFGSAPAASHQESVQPKAKTEALRVTEQPEKKTEIPKTNGQTKKGNETKSQKKSGKGKKILIALLVCSLVSISLPPVGVGLFTLWITFILLQK